MNKDTVQLFILVVLAKDLREIVKETGCSKDYNLVVPDGTWRQAKKIFKYNTALQQARKVAIINKLLANDLVETRKQLTL